MSTKPERLASALRVIGSVPSRTEKARLMAQWQDDELMKKVLYYTYSPYYKYHIRKIPIVPGKGTMTLEWPKVWATLLLLHQRKLTGIAAKETVIEIMQSLTEDGSEVFRGILLKNLKIGIATTIINQLFNNLIPSFHCQGVKDWEPHRVEFPVYVSPKIDGVRGEYRHRGLFTRMGKRVIGVEHLIRYIEGSGTNLELSGELFIPGMEQDFDRVSGIIRSNKATKPNVKYALFDIRNYRDLPYFERYTKLTSAYYAMGTTPQPDVFYIPHFKCENEDQVMRVFNWSLAKGFEGVVVKSWTAKVKNKKTFDWMRIVKGVSFEEMIVNVYPSEELPGHLGGVVLKSGVHVGSGFDMDQRREWLAHPEKILGKYATFNAKEKTKAGSYRQPIFKGIRWDI